MQLLPFGQLPPFKPRHFVPAEINLGDWEQIRPLFDRLEKRCAEASSGADLERWLLEWSELDSAIDQESSTRYIAMTCHTEDAEAEKAYLHFIEHIDPKLKPRQFKLCKMYLDHPARPLLPRQRYKVFGRDVAVYVELFRQENVPLETEQSKLEQKYQKLAGSLTVQFRGEEKTLVQMSKYLEEPDRSMRQEAWELVANRRLQETANFEDIFDHLLKLRETISGNAGFDNYRDYAFRRHRRFDYGPGECEAFHAAIETEIMPLVRQLQEDRRQKLKLGSLRPWDLSVDPLNRPPLRPFSQVSDLVDRTGRIFHKVSPELGADFDSMRQMRLLDLDNRKGKAPGGYQSDLSEARLPFIFMNAVGLQRDVETLLHEGGHAFHTLAARKEDLSAYRHAPIEFCEVASMSMELLGNEFLEEFYNPAEANRARRTHLETVIGLFPWIASVDAFQHWIYTHPKHSRSQRRVAWNDILDRFGGIVDWSGHEEARSYLWHRQLHIFLHPFYYIEYGIAQLGALQVWANSKHDRAGALRSYRNALALGGSRPLPELFRAAGCQFAFDAATVRPLAAQVQQELSKLR